MSQQEGSSLAGAPSALPLSPLDIEVRNVRVGRNRPCVITLAYRNSQFVVELLPGSSTTTPTLLRYGFDPGDFASKYPAGPGPLPGYNEPNSIESVYLEKLNAGVSEDGILDAAGFQTLYEIEDLIFATGSHLFQDLAGPIPLDGSTTTLSEALNPERFWLQMITADGNASLIHRQEFIPPTLSFERQDMSGVRADLPVFDISQIEILETLVPERAYKVLANNRIQFCKVTGRGFERAAIGRDCQMLQRIRDAGLASSIRVPRLEGLVTTNQQSEIVIGFLTDFITPGSPLSNLGDLRDNIDQASKPQREHWASQAKHIIEQLHGIGVVWGNVCPRNMLLDSESNLWVIGFSGSRTWGFVSLEFMGTKEGDLMGLEMIRQYLQV
ncbi:hypothetical protein L207DRAFT_641881 [Hyaloscypha variabilis F]|uniref:Protein kinase domain-containing protein n=1 Tax=Hyaloscypha variabilis (strain UAMH 11265 / GT02V1 / F) TaxID=1149755 RepID=A0A2J6QUT2_HYAVF|nr:hypothetical protein L207DRAFT_641881 [Hyaloscypha variabilis F]